MRTCSPLENYKEIREVLGSRRTAARMEDDGRQQLLSQKSKLEQEQQRKAMLEGESCRKDQQQLQRRLIGAQGDELSTLQTQMPAHTIRSFRSCPPRPRATPRGGTSLCWFRRHWMGGRSCAGTGHPRSLAILCAVVPQGGQPGKFSLLPGGPGASRRL